MPFFESQDGSGARIHYEIEENVLPEDTLFIHGNMASRRWWYPALESFRGRDLSRKGAMILVEFRGCGKSSPPRSQEDVDMELFARDFIGLVKTLRRGPLHLVGHSTGGLIAALMLVQAPELFKRAVLLDPVGARGVVFHDSLATAFQQMKTDKNLVAAVMGSTIYEHNSDSEFFRQVVVEDAFHAVQTVGDRVLRALANFDTRQLLAKIKHPALVLHGEHDVLLPRQDSEEVAALMSAQFSIIPNQGHCANIENPDQFTRMTAEFLFES